MDLSREITSEKFNRYPVRDIYQVVHLNNGNATTFLTKDSAYAKMEKIHHALEFNGCLEIVELNDLDQRVNRLVTDAGSIYELITVKIEY